MSSVVEAMTELLNFPEALEKIIHSTSRHSNGGGATFPADILDTPKEYVFYLDVPGLSKSDIQVRNPSELGVRSWSRNFHRWIELWIVLRNAGDGGGGEYAGDKEHREEEEREWGGRRVQVREAGEAAAAEAHEEIPAAG